jgi:H+/Cl- antiporter ClcA
MFSFSLSGFVKFLVGILLTQLGTVLLVYTAIRTNLEQTWPLFAALAITIGAITALWFHSIADSARKQALSRAKESFSREREKIRVRAEQEKTKEVRNTQRQIHREKQRARTGNSLKTGVMIGGAVGVGVVMLMTQMVTLGLLTLSTAGGAALGYGVRARQERLGRGARGFLGRREREVKVLEAEPVTGALKGPRSTGRPLGDA